MTSFRPTVGSGGITTIQLILYIQMPVIYSLKVNAFASSGLHFATFHYAPVEMTSVLEFLLFLQIKSYNNVTNWIITYIRDCRK